MTPTTRSGIVVVGGGYASHSFVKHFREHDKTTPLTVLSSEHYPCYDRRRIFEIINKKSEAEDLVLDNSGLELGDLTNVRIGRRVVKVDRENRFCALNGGEKVPYDKLIIATGATPTRLNILGSHLPGVFYLRDAQSAIAIRRYCSSIRKVRNAVVIGGGPLGIEVACGLRSIAQRVFMVHRAAFPLEEYLDVEASLFLVHLLKKMGILLQLNNEAISMFGNKKVENVDCHNGQTLPADLVIICAGVQPQVNFMPNDPMITPGGIAVDQTMRTPDPNIYAIGDVANIPGIKRRSWINAAYTARITAHQILGGGHRFDHHSFSSRHAQAPLSIGVDGLNLLAVGSKDENKLERALLNKHDSSSYRCVYHKDNTVKGGIAINDNHFASTLLQDFINRETLARLSNEFSFT